MRRFTLLPLALAVSSAAMLSGCFGGGGGGGGSSSSAPEPAPGGGFTYTLSVDVPESLGLTLGPARLSPAEQLASALINLLVPPALAELLDGLQPGDFTLRNLSDDAEREISEVVDNGDGTYSVTTADEAGLEHYFEIALSNASGINPGISFRVPASSGSLTATPITTLVTKLLANRISQLDELEPAEINDLISEIEDLVSQNEDIQQALYNAIYTSTSTEDLLEEVGARLAAVIDDQLDEKATPPVTATLASQATGSYYSSSTSLGVFRSGYLLGGHRTLNADISVAGDQATFRLAAGDNFDYEFVNLLGSNSSTEARAWIDDEADEAGFTIDSRGFSMPSREEVTDYDRDSGEYPQCAVPAADCSDREFESASRLLAAGPADAPFNVLVDSTFQLREVRDRNSDNALVEQVMNGSLGIIVKKATSRPALSGSYGMIELSGENPGTLDLSSFVGSFDFASNGTLQFCETVERGLYIELGNIQPTYYGSTAEPGDNCGNAVFSLASDGELKLAETPEELTDSPLSGWASADGLTLVLSRESPSLQDVLDSDDGDRLWVAEGERQFVVGVKAAQDANMAGQRYRLFGLGTDAQTGSLAAHRFNAGFLDFDSNTSANLAASLQTQVAVNNGLGDGSNSDPLNISLTEQDQVSVGSDGQVSLSGQTTLADGREATFSANGYVQQGNRLLILNYRLDTEAGDAIGLLVGVLQP